MISVFTPLSASGNKYIEAAFQSLLDQTYTDWEWVVLENHGGKLPVKIREHAKVRREKDSKLQGIGALKRRACSLCKGEYLFELDHDDLLHPDALAEAVKALSDADFASSDSAYFNPDWSPHLFHRGAGWTKNYAVRFQDHDLIAQVSPPLTPQNMRKIEWAPDHFRAWRTEAYWGVGGHNPELPVADDHDLLMRMYLAGCRMKQIPKCLYFYRVYPEQTVSKKNALIHQHDWELYDRSIHKLAEKFADSLGPQPFRKIDLCGGIDPAPGYLSLDLASGQDLNSRWPLEDSSVGVIRANDAIEHLQDPVNTMNEAFRVLAPGGFFLINVPSTDGRGAFQDPTHVSFWNENSFWYYTREAQARYIRSAGWEGRFQCARLRTYFPYARDEERADGSNWFENHKLSYVEAHLIALKEGYDPYGFIAI